MTIDSRAGRITGCSPWRYAKAAGSSSSPFAARSRKPTSSISTRAAGSPKLFKDRQRLYVVPQPDLKLLVRLYAAYQQAIGSRPPTVVETLDEAFELLQVTAVDFRPQEQAR